VIFRRRRLPAELEAPHAAFLEVLAEVEPAKETLTDCMPTTRMPGRPLPDALIEYESHVERAAAMMSEWRCAPTERVWQACARGLDEALAHARRLREEAPDLGGFEGLLGTVESLIDPLQPFEDAARRFDALRV
jgi:hypothetical protein